MESANGSKAATDSANGSRSVMESVNGSRSILDSANGLRLAIESANGSRSVMESVNGSRSAMESANGSRTAMDSANGSRTTMDPANGSMLSTGSVDVAGTVKNSDPVEIEPGTSNPDQDRDSNPGDLDPPEPKSELLRFADDSDVDTESETRQINFFFSSQIVSRKKVFSSNLDSSEFLFLVAC